MNPELKAKALEYLREELGVEAGHLAALCVETTWRVMGLQNREPVPEDYRAAASLVAGILEAVQGQSAPSPLANKVGLRLVS